LKTNPYRLAPVDCFVDAYSYSENAIRALIKAGYSKIKSQKQAYAIQRGLIKRYRAYLESKRSLADGDWVRLLLEIKPGNYYRYKKKLVESTVSDYGGKKTCKDKKASILQIVRVNR
jgi:hypothetical protein